MDSAPSDQAVFAEALLRETPEARAAYLEAACGTDTALLHHVEALLRAALKAGDFLEEPATGLGAEPDTTWVVSGPSEQPGERIGRYKLLERIGEGGCGVVYMAEQQEPVTRRVALKVIKLGMDTKSVIARFEAERQALALMDHPNIAKVFDGGATQTGRPFFVMELVRGVRITEFCDQAKLSTGARLQLFIQVCQAIQHAHQKGIIHRDLKPSNILVTVNDGPPVPKVIDFGIAKATGQRLTDKTLFTQIHAVIGTPAYMSPEQAEMSSVDIDTRSDIYSLGVLLYELLTGKTPFDGERLLSAGLDEMRRIIRETEPPKPSTRLTHLAAADIKTLPAKLETRNSKFQTASRRLPPTSEQINAVRGDMDWIVMKCLEKDRTRRYETVNALAADIQRHLNDEPVLAAAPSVGYKLRKFVKRYRAQVIAGSIVTAALVFGVIATSVSLVWALKEKTRANTAKDQEARARQRAEATVKFVTTALKTSDARNPGGGQDMTILAAMDNAVQDIADGRFKDDPETEAGLRDTIAAIYLNNGRYPAAESLYAQVLETRQRLFKGDHPDVGDSLNHRAVALMAMGRHAEAEPVARRALDMNGRLHPGDHKDVGDSLNYLARALQNQSRFAESEPLFVQSLEMWQRLSKEDSLDVAVCLRDLAFVRQSLGRFPEAEQLFIQSLEMIQRLFKGDCPATAIGLSTLAEVRQQQGHSPEAEALFVRALEMQQRLFKGDHPDVADSLSNLAVVRQSLGRLAEAEPLYARALEMYQRLFKGDHPKVAQALRNVAHVRNSPGRAAEAEPLYLQALEMHQRLFTGDHARVAEILGSLAILRQSLGRAAEAEPMCLQALEMSQRLFKGDHPDVALGLSNLAVVRQSLGRLSEAEPLFLQALEMYRRLYKGKGDHPNVAQTLSNLARTRQALGQTAEARQGFDEAVAMLRRLSPDGSPNLARKLWHSGRARLDNQEAAAALPELEEAVTMAEKLLPPEHPQLKDYRETLARCKQVIEAQQGK